MAQPEEMFQCQSAKIGNARCAVQAKKCSSRWPVLDLPKMNRNALAKPALFDIKYDRFYQTNLIQKAT